MRGVRGLRRRAVLAAVSTASVVMFAPQGASATWSIVGVDAETGEVGVAVASCVGFEVTAVPVLVPGVGAAASQAAISEASGERFVQVMAPGTSAQDIVDAVVEADGQPEDRQFGVVVLDGSGAGWSGAATLDVAVDRRNDAHTAAAQGNILVSDQVVIDALAAFDAADGALADRLLAALLAGADAGGDSRCAQQTATAAALLVASTDDAVYAQTDASVFGVDPSAVGVPSVFVSVLVERGGGRAPDRLAEVWSGVDRDASSIVVRQIDDGADTAAGRLRLVASVALGAAVVGALAVAVLAFRRLRRPTAGRDRPSADS